MLSAETKNLNEPLRRSKNIDSKWASGIHTKNNNSAGNKKGGDQHEIRHISPGSALGYDGKNGKFVKPADPFESINNVLLFLTKLRLVIDMLPDAATADTKVLASRLNTMHGWFENIEHFRFGVISFGSYYLCTHAITGNSIVDKTYETLVASDCLSSQTKSINTEFYFLFFV